MSDTGYRTGAECAIHISASSPAARMLRTIPVVLFTQPFTERTRTAPRVSTLSSSTRSSRLDEFDMRASQLEPDAIDLLKWLEEVGFLERPQPRGVRGRIRNGQKAVHCPPRRLVRSLHTGDIGEGSDVIGREKQVIDFDLGFRTKLERPCSVDEQRFGIDRLVRVREFNVGIQKPRDQIGVVDERGTVVIQVLF